MRNKRISAVKKTALPLLLLILLFAVGCKKPNEVPTLALPETDRPAESFELSLVPDFSGEPYFIINDNNPFFTDEEITSRAYEIYKPLDKYGRCTVAYACLGVELMPTEERGNIGMVKPTGWHTVKYDCVDGKYLYNRCHLIGFQLSGENANERNLITGTRYMNIEGMLPFENMLADYIKETSNHVMYRVSPIFKDNELVARGVLMEAYSVEDNGHGICFCVFAYNAQPDIKIDYMTGESCLTSEANTKHITYVLNTSTKRFHLPACPSLEEMSLRNRKNFYGLREELILSDYEPCGLCKP